MKRSRKKRKTKRKKVRIRSKAKFIIIGRDFKSLPFIFFFFQFYSLEILINEIVIENDKRSRKRCFIGRQID